MNPRPKKKLLESMDKGSDDDPTYQEEVQEYVFDESEESQEEAQDESAAISNLPYVEVNLPDGRVARQCRASKTCPKRWAFIVKRMRMIEHLKTHGIDIDIPHRQQGRPLASEARIRMAPLPNPDIRSWHLQVVKRFAQKDRKFNENCKRYKRIQRMKAMQAWEKLHPTLRINSKEDYVADFVEKEMASYLATKAERLDKIQKRIDMGYEKNSRLKPTPAWLEVAMEDYHNEDPFEGLEAMAKDHEAMPSTSNVPLVSHEDDEVPKERMSPFHKIDHKNMPGSSNMPNASRENVGVPKATRRKVHTPKAPKVMPAMDKKPATSHEVKVNEVPKVTHGKDDKVMARKNKMPIASHEETKYRAKLPLRSGKIRHNGPQPTQPIEIDETSPHNSEFKKWCHIKFIISAGHVHVEETGNQPSPKKATPSNIALYRVESHTPLTFVSSRSTLYVDMDGDLLRSILCDEASTRTMDLFGLWMENTESEDIMKKVHFVDSMWYPMAETCGSLAKLFATVDIGEIVFTFFPVVMRKHWTMFVLYMNHQQNKNHLMFFDSLGMIDQEECMPALLCAFSALAESTSNQYVKQVLSSPETEIQMRTLQVPFQKTGIDCGYYVMAGMQRFITHGLKKSNTRRQLTKLTFDDEHVMALKRNLHDWVLLVLGSA